MSATEQNESFKGNVSEVNVREEEVGSEIEQTVDSYKGIYYLILSFILCVTIKLVHWIKSTTMVKIIVIHPCCVFVYRVLMKKLIAGNEHLALMLVNELILRGSYSMGIDNSVYQMDTKADIETGNLFVFLFLFTIDTRVCTTFIESVYYWQIFLFTLHSSG